MRHVLLLTLALSLAVVVAAETSPPAFEPWSPGYLDIHQISTGRGNAAFLILPDGTTLLVDTGDAGEYVPLATAFPDDSRGAGEWVARYVRRMAGDDAVIDYAVATHFHADHVGAPYPPREESEERGYWITGLAEVAEFVSIGKLIDRGFPDYGEPATPKERIVESYKNFATFVEKERGTVRERVRVGTVDQVKLLHDAGAFPEFEVRAVAGNGIVWTGHGDEITNRFPSQDALPKEDRVPENACSIALNIRYGPFGYYTGGDLYGLPEPGAPAWWDLETPVAKAIGKTDVMVVNHHGSIEPANPFFLATLAPRVIVIPAWSPTHPSPDVLKRLLSTRIWPEPRDVFLPQFRDETKATIGRRATRVASDSGHVVVRVDPGGATYRVYVLDNTDESDTVKSLHGPYESGEAPRN